MVFPFTLAVYLLCKCISAFQCEIKSGTFTRFTLDPDSATVEFNDPFYEGKANPGTLAFGIEFVKEGKDAFVIFGGNAHAIVFDQYGCRITGVAAGTGDVPMREAYRIIRSNPDMQRLNLEVEFDPGSHGPEEARRLEYAAVVENFERLFRERGIAQEK